MRQYFRSVICLTFLFAALGLLCIGCGSPVNSSTPEKEKVSIRKLAEQLALCYDENTREYTGNYQEIADDLFFELTYNLPSSIKEFEELMKAEGMRRIPDSEQKELATDLLPVLGANKGDLQDKGGGDLPPENGSSNSGSNLVEYFRDKGGQEWHGR